MNKFLSIILFFSAFVQAQENVPTDYFSSPLDIPLVLAGDYGELRGNHFHSGLDIKTQQKEGFPVYAAADGYVSRINVSEYGYGKALYINHPNGYSTVYGHLQQYAGNIQEYVKSNQYKKETYEIELFPETSLLPVMKGDLIAYSGDTGSSGGPHLHFEIRDAASRPMNPLMFGIEINDTKQPVIVSLMAYPVEGGQVNHSQNPSKIRLITQKDGSYKSETIQAFGKIGFGIATFDQQDGASNKNGVYRITTAFNGKEKWDVSFQKFSFDETRYLNLYIDYGYLQKNRTSIQKLFREANNPLSLIKQADNDGYIQVEEGFNGDYIIQVDDFKGNNVVVHVPIEGKSSLVEDPKMVTETQDYIKANQANSITKGKWSIYIPANSLYSDTYLNILDKGDTLQFHEDVLPIHNNITITFDASNYKEMDLDKLYVGRLNYKKVPYYNNTTRNGDKLSAKIRTFGSYSLAADTMAPMVKPLNFKDGQWISNNKDLKVKITDDVSGISSYRATINGKFILMEYNYKTDVLTYNFDNGVIEETDNNLKLIVVDNVGNSTTFETIFYRKLL